MIRPALFTVPDWAVLTGVAFAATALLWLLALLALRFRDGRRARERHCPRCFYAMTGTPGLRCPECGHAARDEHDLHRRPRRWWSFALALLLLAAGSLLATGRLLARVDWVALAPTGVLLRSVQSTAWTSTSGGIATYESLAREELWDRDARDRLSDSARRGLVGKQFNLRPPVRVDTRSRWPSGVMVRCDITADMGGVRPRELTVRRADTGDLVLRTALDTAISLPGVNLVRLGEAQAVPPRATLGVFADGEQDVELEMELRERGRLIWTGATHVTFAVGGTAAEVVPPSDFSEAMGRSLETAVRQGLRLSPDRAWVGLAAPAYTGGARECYGFRIEWVPSGPRKPVAAAAEVVGSVWGRANAGGWRGASPAEWWAPVTILDPAFSSAKLTDGSWTVRITADPALALRDFDARECWSGTLEFPAREVVRPTLKK